LLRLQPAYGYSRIAGDGNIEREATHRRLAAQRLLSHRLKSVLLTPRIFTARDDVVGEQFRRLRRQNRRQKKRSSVLQESRLTAQRFSYPLVSRGNTPGSSVADDKKRSSVPQWLASQRCLRRKARCVTRRQIGSRHPLRPLLARCTQHDPPIQFKQLRQRGEQRARAKELRPTMQAGIVMDAGLHNTPRA
jgi:hypothetical protein